MGPFVVTFYYALWVFIGVVLSGAVLFFSVEWLSSSPSKDNVESEIIRVALPETVKSKDRAA